MAAPNMSLLMPVAARRTILPAPAPTNLQPPPTLSFGSLHVSVIARSLPTGGGAGSACSDAAASTPAPPPPRSSLSEPCPATTTTADAAKTTPGGKRGRGAHSGATSGATDTSVASGGVASGGGGGASGAPAPPSQLLLSADVGGVPPGWLESGELRGMLVCGSNTWPAGGEESAAVAIAANLTAAEAAVVAVRPTTATVVSVPLTMGAVTPERAVRKTVRVATIGPAGAGQHVSLFRFATATVTVTAPYPLAPLPPDTLFLCYITDAAGVLRFLSMPVLLPPPPSSEDAAAAAAVAAAAAAAAAASAAAEAADSGSDSGSGGGSAAPGGPTPDTGRPDSRYARPLFTLAMELATAGIMTLPSPELLHGWTRAAESKRIKRCETAAAAAAAEAAKAAAKAAAAKAAAAPRRRGPKKGCRGAYAAVAASAAEGDDGTLSSMLPPLPIVAAAPADVGMAADVLEVAAEEVEEDEEAAGSAPAGGAGAPASKRARTGGDGDGDDDEYDDWSSHYVMPARRARVPVAALVAASLLSAGTDAGDSRASYFLRPGSWAAASRPAAVPTPSPAPAGDSWSASMAPLIDGTVNLTRAHVHTAAGGGDYDSGWGYDNAGATPAGEVVLPLTSHVSTDAAGSWAINAPTPVAARPAGGAPPQWRSWTAAAAAAMEAAEMPALLPAAGLGDSCDSAPLPALDIELAACAAADGSVVPDGSATMRSAGSGSTGDLAAAAAASDSDASDAHLDCHPADGHAAAGLFTFPTATFNSLGSTAW